jgi:soluble lytic murein transglycosylase
VRQARFAIVLVVWAYGCHGSGAQRGRPPPELASSLVPAHTAPAADGGASEEAGDRVDQGLPRLAVVLDDPRLAAARAADEVRDASVAAREVDAARASATLDAGQACAWAYVAGRLHLEAGEAADAAAAFERALSCNLSSYAVLRAAEALVRAGRYDDALVRARAIDEGIVLRDEARLVLADAYAGKGDRASAVPIWRGLLGASPNGLRWADVSLLLAAALVDGVDGPPDSRAQEALDLATRVLVEAPWVDEKGDVTALRTRAAAVLGRPAPALRVDERARQAQAWLDFSKPKRALEVADSVLQAIAPADKKHADAACKAATTRSRSLPRGKTEDAADAWGVAIARCDGNDALVNALYQGAKASASARRTAEARSRFDRVEKLFPEHRLADDARYRSALLAYDQGDEARYLSLLTSIPDVYPDGDMKAEALFRIALTKLTWHDLDGARAALDRLLSLAEPASAVQARATYFRARVSQLMGDTDDARERYQAIVTDQPLSYPMLLAYGRLRAMDEGAARAAIQTAVDREPAGPFFTRAHPELATPAFDRFVHLLEVGEVDAARREAGAAGWTAEGADPEVLWAVAWLFDRAGAPEVGHAFSRARLLDYRSHWPAGRWRLPWQAAYPRPWDAIVLRESESASIPRALTWAIMREESAFDPDAKSVANAIGLMQLMSATARMVARGTPLVADEPSLHRPDVSIALGARFLGSLRTSFASNPALAIAAYNGGSAAVRRWLGERSADDFDVFVERIPFDETRAYIKRVLASQAAYAYLYEPHALDEVLGLPQRASGQDVVASP